MNKEKVFSFVRSSIRYTMVLIPKMLCELKYLVNWIVCFITHTIFSLYKFKFNYNVSLTFNYMFHNTIYIDVCKYICRDIDITFSIYSRIIDHHLPGPRLCKEWKPITKPNILQQCAFAFIHSIQPINRFSFNKTSYNWQY